MKEQNVEQLRERLSPDEEVQEPISVRAYEIYQSRDCAHGCDLDDWLQAEDEILTALTEPKAPDLTTGGAQAADKDTTRQSEALLSEAAPRQRKGDA